MKRAELIERPGGHHFDGNYDALAARILERLTMLDEAKAKLEEIVVLSGTLTATLPRRRL